MDAKVLILCIVLVTDSVVGSRGQNSVPFRPNRPTPHTFTNGEGDILVTRNVAQAMPLYVVGLGD